ncbi:MAG: UDP-glucose 4-epimerase GalE, partial [Pseudobdellovibrionaceae bacterium]
GGAGYIGSHTCKALARQGHTPVTLDNLVYGHEWAVKWGPFYQVDIQDKEEVLKVLLKEKIEAVIHFAAFAYVGESHQNPLKYYQNNVLGSMSLLEAMKNANVLKFVFSSTCASYGIPERTPIEETFPQEPINPYGRSKLIVEKILQDYAQPFSFCSIALRYFNASGADADLEIGEDHDPETHLIPLTLDAALGRRKEITVFGTDYPTEDGTCVRDYIHVSDLAQAHVLALENLQEPGFEAFNLGTGKGASVKQVISEVAAVTGREVPVVFGERRPGDPPALVASGEKAMKKLKWSPQHSDLRNIISTAYHWQEKHFGKR